MAPSPPVHASLAAALIAGLLAGAPKPSRKVKARAEPPPVVSLVELEIRTLASAAGPGIDKKVRVAHPKDWDGDVEDGGRTIRLFGPDGEGELVIAAVSHPGDLGAHLSGLKQRHPGSVPSPPQAVDVAGVNPVIGERATRFEITGREVGEMIMIERGGLIVLFAAVVRPDAWEALRSVLKRCYPTVQVTDRGAR